MLNSRIPRDVYAIFGQLNYGKHVDFSNLQQRIWSNAGLIKFIYIGQLKSGTEIKEGVGIWVDSDGITFVL